MSQMNLKTCLTDALVNASKCWLVTKDCNPQCIDSLNIIEVHY